MADFSDYPARVMTRNKRHSFKFTVTDRVTGSAVNITSWTKLWVTAKSSPTLADADALFQITLTSSADGVVTKTNAAGGVCSVDIESSATEDAPNVRTVYFLDGQGLDANGDPWNLFRMQLVVLPEITTADS